MTNIESPSARNGDAKRAAAQENIVHSIVLHGMAHGGEAVGRLPDGRAAFVEGGLPGETVSARETEARERFWRGVLSETPEPTSPDRVEAPCPHYGGWPARSEQPRRWCGGCQWQHADYAAQLKHKRDVLRDALMRIGKIDAPEVSPVIASDSQWGYRNTLHVRMIGGRPGLIALSGRDLVPLTACHIAHPLIADLLERFEADLPDGTAVSLRAGINTGDQLVLVEDLDDSIDEIEVGADTSVVVLGSKGQLEVAVGRDHFVEQIKDLRFEVPATAFFQVNSAMAERMVDQVSSMLPTRMETVVDLFGGVGLLGLSIADRAREVFVVDSDAAAIGAATRNATGMDHVTLLEGDVLEGIDHVKGPLDVVIVDPPRSGLSKRLVKALGDRTPGTLIYVSCEPSTLARDIARLAEFGYRLESCVPLDMFPNTYHVESVSRLTRWAADDVAQAQ